MLAAVATGYGDPDVLRVVEVDPGPLRPGSVRVDVRAAGVNPADWKQYRGDWGTDPSKLPMRLGHEAAGVVVEVAPGVEGIAAGDEVIAHRAPGAYAQQLVVPVSAVLHKPAAMPWEEAAGLLLAGVTAVHALEATGVTRGDTLVVHGASGAVGSVAVQLAVARGAVVLGTASEANHDYLRGLGAVPVAYGPGLAERLAEAAPDGLSAAIDTSGATAALEASVALIADRGRIATIAGFRDGAGLGIRLLGAGEGADPGTEIRRAARSRLVELWQQGDLRVRVGATYPLAQVADAHRAGQSGAVHGKIVLLP
ncbi:MAG: alcohol dehydrogenase [Actinotalea sp.]|nr:alcohol dehydrogenase [Actinotalea sp.]